MDSCLSCKKVNQDNLSRTYRTSKYINHRRVPMGSRLKCSASFTLCSDCQQCAVCRNEFTIGRKVARQCANALGLTCDKCTAHDVLEKYKAKRKAEEIESPREPKYPSSRQHRMEKLRAAARAARLKKESKSSTSWFSVGHKNNHRSNRLYLIAPTENVRSFLRPGYPPSGGKQTPHGTKS
jgi:hypothetical protein